MTITSFNKILFGICLITLMSCKHKHDNEHMQITISSNWKFHNTKDSVWHGAHVPGDVLSDLIDNNLLADPYFRINDKKAQSFEMNDWEYLTHFDVTPEIFEQDVIELNFDGLDTYADIFLNDSLILKTDNMFRSWSVNCKGFIHSKSNALRIYFHSSVKEGLEKLHNLPYLLPTLEEQAPEDKQTSPFTRKASFQYGFDGGPRLVNAGIWRPIHIVGWSSTKIVDTYFRPMLITALRASYETECSILSGVDGNFDIELLINDKLVQTFWKVSLKKGENLVNLPFEIKEPHLWWTNNLGNPYLYTISIKLKRNQSLLAQSGKLLGIRKIELVQNPDSFGTSFYFKLNGVPLYMKGANYIPTDALLSRETPERYKHLLSSAALCNMNMLRVWGGGIYENDQFYNCCDSLGILVWQDFMFSSAMQPGDSAHLKNIYAEAVENVKRLRNHACLALWCGNSEILENWNYLWKDIYQKNEASIISRHNDSIFKDILPAVVKTYNPSASYWMSSPSTVNAGLPDSRSGDEHDWSVWYNAAPIDAYTENIGRFVTEYGMQSFPAVSSLRKFTVHNDFKFKSEVLEWKQRNTLNWISPGIDGNDMIRKYILDNFKEPAGFDRFVYLSQQSQALGLKTAIEHHRISRPKNMGTLFWQFNDCWPGITWSVIDYYGIWKPAAYTIRQAFAPIVVIPVEENNRINIYSVSDVLKETEAILLVKIIDFYGNSLYVKQIPVKIPANKSQVLLSMAETEVLKNVKHNECCLIAQLNLPSKTLSQNILYFTQPKELLLPHASIEIGVNEAVKGYNVILRSDVFVRNVFLSTTSHNCEFSENNIDLLPGKRLKINVRYEGTKAELQKDLKIEYL